MAFKRFLGSKVPCSHNLLLVQRQIEKINLGLFFPNYNAYQKYKHGDIAQLGERLNGIQEVSGSIPLISTVSGFNNLEKQQCLV